MTNDPSQPAPPSRAAEPVNFQIIKDHFAQQEAIRLFIKRMHQHRVHVSARFAQGLRKRARHVAESTGFGERYGLGR